MNGIMKGILWTIAGAMFLIGTTAYIAISDSKADFTKEIVTLNVPISLSEISTKYTKRGHFKSAVQFQHENHSTAAKEFYGQEITLANNPKVDRILIGLTNNLISRLEIWKDGQLIQSEEKGFVGKMTWGEPQTLSVAFYDQTTSKYEGKSKIAMRLYSGSGFLGDIGTLHMDLTEYGDLSGEKTIGVFAKSLSSVEVNKPTFSNLRIWKNYRSFD